MAGKFKRIVTGSMSLLLISAVLLISSKCDEDDSQEFVFMAFEIPLTLLPEVDQIKIGDTLWLVGNFKDSIYEIHSQKKYKLSEYDFGLRVCISKLINVAFYLSEQQPAVENFKVINQKGSLSQISSICSELKFEFQSNRYGYKIGLIPEKTGTYSLNLLWPIDIGVGSSVDLRPVIDLGKSKNGTTRIPVYEAFYVVVNEGRTNFELFKQHCRAASMENPSPINVYYEQKGSYTFRVIE